MSNLTAPSPPDELDDQPASHILHTRADLAGKSWCGVESPGWAFRSIDHAAYAIDGGIEVCPECIAIARETLARQAGT